METNEAQSCREIPNTAMEMRADGSNNEAAFNAGFGNNAQDAFNYSLVAIKEEMETFSFDNLLEDGGHNPLDNSYANDSINDMYKDCPWYEPIPRSSMARCRLCNVRLEKNSFKKHVQTQKHIMLLTQLTPTGEIKEEAQDVGQMWDIYKERHPWLVADPLNPHCAHCMYCKKRLFYAFSEIKRVSHENSEQHKRMEEEYKLASNETFKQSNNNSDEDNANYDNEHDDESMEEDEEEEENDEDEEEEEEANDKSSCNETSDTDSYSDKYKHIGRGSKEWYDKYPWSKRYIKDSNFMYCTYCDEVMPIIAPRHVHNKCKRHRIAEIALEKKFKKLYNRQSVVNKAMKFYSWLIYSDNNTLATQCKYCNVPIIRQGCRKHQQSQRHKDAFAAYQEIAKQKSKAKQQKNNEPSVNTPNNVKQNPLNSPMQNNVLLWQKRFPWLSYKKIRPNYAYCELCEVAVYMTSLKCAVRHQRAPSHIRQYNQLRQEHLGKANAPKPLYKKQNRPTYIWFIADKKNILFGKCKYCNVPVLYKARQRHCMLRDHRTAALRYEQGKTTTEEGTDVAESNNESNSINETFPSTANSEVEICVPATQIKDSYSIAVETAKRLTDAHYDLIRFTRKLQKDNAETLPKIIKAPSAVESLVSSKITETVSVATSPVIPPPPSPPQLPQLPLDAAIVPANQLPPSPLDVAIVPTTQLPQSQLDTAIVPTNQLPRPSPIHVTKVSTTPSPQSPLDVSTIKLPNIHALTADKKQYPLELFMLSINETVKQLPADLIAEWKMKVMPILYDLEIRSLRRQQNKNGSNENSTTPASDAQTSSNAQFANAPATRVDNQNHVNNSTEMINNKNNIKCNDKIIINRAAKMPNEIGENLLRIIDSRTDTGISNSVAHKITSSVDLRNSVGFHQPPPKPNNSNSGKPYQFTLPPQIQVSKGPKVFKSPASNTPLDANSNAYSVGKSKVPISQSSSADGVRHIQINSQTSSKVIPLQTWAQVPPRRYSLNLSPQQVQHAFVTSVRTSPQKFPSMNGAVNKQ